ncbi:MAG TPA: type I methionyl aminopeptidase [Spirochaetia bacterium]|nr:type I methionyl aminopeptidase [Spirochaetia bacterium]
MEKPVPLKTSIEVSRIRRTCRLIESLFLGLKPSLRPGVTTLEVNNICVELLKAGGGVAAMKGYRGYPASICTSVNNVAAHGVPGGYELRAGDIISVDISAQIEGWHGDGAWTYVVEEASPDARRLLKAAWHTTMMGIRAARAGARLGDVGAAIQETARRYGCVVLDKFVGHGIGLGMHEEPLVLNFGRRGTGQPIVPGMVLTIEPILCLGRPEAHVLGDGWSIVTNDNSFCAQFEHTVAVFSDKTEVLTFSTGDPTAESEAPPYY